MRENTDQNNYEYGLFSRSVNLVPSASFRYYRNARKRFDDEVESSLVLSLGTCYFYLFIYLFIYFIIYLFMHLLIYYYYISHSIILYYTLYYISHLLLLYKSFKTLLTYRTRPPEVFCWREVFCGFVAVSPRPIYTRVWLQ